VRHDGAEGVLCPPGEEKRKLVDVFHDYVGPLRLDCAMYGTATKQGEAVPTSDALDTDPIDRGTLRSTLPSGTYQAYPVTSKCQSAEDLEEMNFRAAGVRIGPILPVHQKNVHGDKGWS